MTGTSTTATTGTTDPLSRTAGWRRPSLARLTAVELRKTLDTRASRWLLALLGLLALAALLHRLATDAGAPVFRQAFEAPVFVVQQVLPAIGVLAMTSEWTQRGALTTFTLVPRRGRVLTAKLVAVLALALVAVVLVAGASALATAGAGLVAGAPVDWSGAVRAVAGAGAGAALATAMGAGLGALLQQSAAALVTCFIAPTLVTAAAAVLLGDGARWVAVYTAIAHVSQFDLAGVLAPTLVALGGWIVLPLAVGTVRALRREVQ